MKGNKLYSVIGKIVVGIIILVIAFPWVFSFIGIKFSAPVGNMYYMQIENDNPAEKSYMVITFSNDNTMCVYRFEENVFSEIAGLKTTYKYSGKSFLHIGTMFISAEPSILPWNNYEFRNQYTVDKAILRIKPKKIDSVHVSEIDSIDNSEKALTIIVNTKSMKIEDYVLNLVEEDNYEISSAIRRFDEQCKEEWRSDK